MSAHAELSSASTLLDDLVKRISGIADSLTPAERESVAAELAEVERNLGNAQRRLSRLVEATS